MSSAVYRCVIGLIGVLVFSAVAMLGVTIAAPRGSATSERSQGQSNQKDGYSDTSQRRLREGTTISDTTGFFRQDGDGATFVTDEEYEFGGLPNLNLERVVRTLKTSDESSSIRWSVSGTITEFSGRNFLLISRAVYKSTAPTAQPSVPEQLSN